MARIHWTPAHTDAAWTLLAFALIGAGIGILLVLVGA